MPSDMDRIPCDDNPCNMGFRYMSHARGITNPPTNAPKKKDNSGGDDDENDVVDDDDDDDDDDTSEG
jgi:hypothetical protein